MSDHPSLLLPEWEAPPGVRALSTTRQGGVSLPPWDSLNLGAHVGDARESVEGNRGRLCDAAGLPAEPHWLEQVHGIAVADLDQADEGRRADAAVSSKAGRVCVVMTADCLPVVLASSDGAVVGVAHAGWRGLASGVVEATLACMRSKVRAGTPLAGLARAGHRRGTFRSGRGRARGIPCRRPPGGRCLRAQCAGTLAVRSLPASAPATGAGRGRPDHGRRSVHLRRRGRLLLPPPRCAASGA